MRFDLEKRRITTWKNSCDFFFHCQTGQEDTNRLIKIAKSLTVRFLDYSKGPFCRLLKPCVYPTSLLFLSTPALGPNALEETSILRGGVDRSRNPKP